MWHCRDLVRCIYILVMQRFRVVYRGISHESVVFSWYTHQPLGECVYQENTSDSWDIPRFYVFYTMPENTSGQMGRLCVIQYG